MIFSMKNYSAINQAPDATAFLSTCTLLVGVLVTIVGTALAQLLIGNPEVTAQVVAGRRKRMITVVALFVIVDLWGVFFPLFVLAFNTLGGISHGLVVGVLISTCMVIILNLIGPPYISVMVRVYRLASNLIDTKWKDISSKLVERGYLTENDVSDIESGELSVDSPYDSNREEVRNKARHAISRLILLDQPHGANLIGRLLYRLDLLMIEDAVDRIISSSQLNRDDLGTEDDPSTESTSTGPGPRPETMHHCASPSCPRGSW